MSYFLLFWGVVVVVLISFSQAAKMGMPISGIVRLPTKIKRWTVLRSPHGDKKSRDQVRVWWQAGLLF